MPLQSQDKDRAFNAMVREVSPYVPKLLDVSHPVRNQLLKSESL